MNRFRITLFELFVATIASLVILFVVLNIVMPTGSRRHPQVKDANQVNEVIKAMTTWSINNKEAYPVPSLLDRNNLTVRGPGLNDDQAAVAGKDNTGNFLSILIWNGLITPQQCIAYGESSSAVRVDEGYEMKTPKACTIGGGTGALWDPGFSGTAEAAEGQGDAANTPRRRPGISNNSYAHASMLGGTARAKAWSFTYNDKQALLGNRGPRYRDTTGNDLAPFPDTGKWELAPGPRGAGSRTLRIHGAPDTWEGNIGYNDTHVNYETRPDPPETTYRSKAAAGTIVRSDNLFVDESDEDNGVPDSTPANAFMHNTNNWLRPVARVLGVSGTDGKPVYTITRWVD